MKTFRTGIHAMTNTREISTAFQSTLIGYAESSWLYIYTVEIYSVKYMYTAEMCIYCYMYVIFRVLFYVYSTYHELLYRVDNQKWYPQWKLAYINKDTIAKNCRLPVIVHSMTFWRCQVIISLLAICVVRYDSLYCLYLSQVSNIRRTLVGNKSVDHSNVVGASPVGAAPTTSSFST